MSHSLNARCQDHGHVPHPDRGCAEGCGTHGVTDVPCWRECPDWAGLTEAEREALRDWWDSEVEGESAGTMLANLDAAVESIVAGRVATAKADALREAADELDSGQVVRRDAAQANATSGAGDRLLQPRGRLAP